jgi:hypothetical protein
MVSSGMGRPKFAYRVPSTAAKQVEAALGNPFEALLTLHFSRFRHVCRFEKGGYCKEADAGLKTAPKSENKNYNHFTPII